MMVQGLTFDLSSNNSIFHVVPNDTIDFMSQTCLPIQILEQEYIVSTNEIVDLRERPDEDSYDDPIDMNIYILSQAELDAVDLEKSEAIEQQVDQAFILLTLANVLYESDIAIHFLVNQHMYSNGCTPQ